MSPSWVRTARTRESLAALGACAAASLLAQRGLLRDDVVEGDALVHQYWMRGFADPQLFDDPLTAELRRSERYPDGYEALFRLASTVVDPIAFGEWLGIVLMAAAGWLVFAIVREHTTWRAAPWVGAALFLALDGHRFSGGFPRGFLHVVVLLTVLLALRRSHLAAALVAAGGALVYPPAALLAIGVLALSALGLEGRRPRVDRQRGRLALLALGLAAAAIAGPELVAGGTTAEVLTADEARRYPDFGPQGPLHFFVPSTLEYLSQNRSGLDLRASSSILALAAVALLLARPRANVRLLRPEVLALPVVSLAAFALAHAVLFRLYLPHRYTYPLVAFAAIVVAVALKPTWDAATAHARARPRVVALLLGPPVVAALAVFVFPLGPEWPADSVTGPMVLAAAGAAVLAVAGGLLAGRVPASVLAGGGASVTALWLVLALLADDRPSPGQRCEEGPATRYLASLPKDAVVAGDPIDLRCVVVTARRAVVISTQLAPSYEREYFLRGRGRMFDTLRAVYGPDPGAIAALRTRYAATHLWVRRDAVRSERAAAVRWQGWRRPFGRFVRGMLDAGEPAVLSLPATCRRWSHGAEAVYDVGCIAAAGEGLENVR